MTGLIDIFVVKSSIRGPPGLVRSIRWTSPGNWVLKTTVSRRDRVIRHDHNLGIVWRGAPGNRGYPLANESMSQALETLKLTRLFTLRAKAFPPLQTETGNSAFRDMCSFLPGNTFSNTEYFSNTSLPTRGPRDKA